MMIFKMVRHRLVAVQRRSPYACTFCGSIILASIHIFLILLLFIGSLGYSGGGIGLIFLGYPLIFVFKAIGMRSIADWPPGVFLLVFTIGATCTYALIGAFLGYLVDLIRRPV